MAGMATHWERITAVSLLLYPAGLLFQAAVAARRAAYHAGLLAAVRLPVPVVVVGNITAGGTGKTPLVLWLAGFLGERGWRPGIVSRGYGGTARGPLAVTADSDPGVCGDEPVLLARRSGCPVWIGADRVRAARALLAAHPRCDVLISDDGLQHYRLARDVEIVVLGGEPPRNPWMIPAGPYREPAARARRAHALVLHRAAGATPAPAAAPPEFGMSLEGDRFYNLLNPALWSGPERFRQQRVSAVAGIGNPRRFFEHLQRLGITFTAHPFPDHHRYAAGELSFADTDAVLMTEKDAVKWQPHATERDWALPVDACVDPALGELVLGKLKP